VLVERPAVEPAQQVAGQGPCGGGFVEDPTGDPIGIGPDPLVHSSTLDTGVLHLRYVRAPE